MSKSKYDGYAAWKGWHREPFGKTSLADAKYYESELRRSGQENLTGLRILELGFGSGSFAAWASSNGADYSGTELIPELVARARAHGYEAYDARQPLDAHFERGSVDLVVAFDVLEHVDRSQLAELLKSVRKSLKPGGLFIARMPSGDSPFSGAIRYGDMTHCVTLGSSAVRQLARSCGFELKAIREPALPVLGLGLRTLLRRSLVVALRKLVYPILLKGFMGGRSAVLSPNMVFVLRRPHEDPGGEMHPSRRIGGPQRRMVKGHEAL